MLCLEDEFTCESRNVAKEYSGGEKCCYKQFDRSRRHVVAESNVEYSLPAARGFGSRPPSTIRPADQPARPTSKHQLVALGALFAAGRLGTGVKPACWPQRLQLGERVQGSREDLC
jgi:hypothetical protein